MQKTRATPLPGHRITRSVGAVPGADVMPHGAAP